MLIQGDARRIPLADESVQVCITSPPYWNLRDYGLPPSVWDAQDGCGHVWGEEESGRDRDSQHLQSLGERLGCGGGNKASAANHSHNGSGQFCRHCSAWRGTLGLEPTPELYVQHMVEVFWEVKRVLRKDGTCWVNLGDSYASSGVSGLGTTEGHGAFRGGAKHDARMRERTVPPGLKPKDLCGIPWRVAFALQADGWWLRSDIIWHKPNPMPESVTDRPTKSHEYVFLLTKSKSYYYDAEAIAESTKSAPGATWAKRKEAGAITCNRVAGSDYNPHGDGSAGSNLTRQDGRRNRRTVWTIPTAAYPGSHFATFPPALVEPCLLAGTSARGACPACGSPWERVVEIPYDDEHPKYNDWLKQQERNDLKYSGHKPQDGRGMGSQVSRYYKEVWHSESSPKTTIGWRPSCFCGAGDPDPCIVLDPFAGTGTVGEVAIRHRRRFVGLDLSRPYLVDLATERLAKVNCTTVKVGKRDEYLQLGLLTRDH